MGIKDHFSVVIRDYPYSIDKDEHGIAGGSQSLMYAARGLFLANNSMANGDYFPSVHLFGASPLHIRGDLH